MNGEQIFRLQRPLVTFLVGLSGFAMAAVLAIAIYGQWSGSLGPDQPTPNSVPFVLKPEFFFPIVVAVLGLLECAALWSIPYEIGIDGEETIRIKSPLRQRMYGRAELTGLVKYPLKWHLLTARHDYYPLVPEFSNHEQLFATLQHWLADAPETGDA